MATAHDLAESLPNGHTLTAADLAALPAEYPSGTIRFELADGRLVHMSPPVRRHAVHQVRIGSALYTQGELRGYGTAMTEVGILLRRSPDRVVGADAAFLTAAKSPGNESSEGYLETIPDLVVEIRSKNDRPADVDIKVAEYLAAGVQCVWVVDPAQRAVAIHRLGQEPLTFVDGDVLKVEAIIPGFQLPLTELFH